MSSTPLEEPMSHRCDLRRTTTNAATVRANAPAISAAITPALEANGRRLLSKMADVENSALIGNPDVAGSGFSQTNFLSQTSPYAHLPCGSPFTLSSFLHALPLGG